MRASRALKGGLEVVMVHWTKVFKKVDLIQHFLQNVVSELWDISKGGPAQVFLQRVLALLSPNYENVTWLNGEENLENFGNECFQFGVSV